MKEDMEVVAKGKWTNHFRGKKTNMEIHIVRSPILYGTGEERDRGFNYSDIHMTCYYVVFIQVYKGRTLTTRLDGWSRFPEGAMQKAEKITKKVIEWTYVENDDQGGR